MKDKRIFAFFLLSSLLYIPVAIVFGSILLIFSYICAVAEDRLKSEEDFWNHEG